MIMTEEDQDLLADLLLHWEEKWESGTDVSPEGLCAECPHLIETLRERISSLKELAWVKKDPGRQLTGNQSPNFEPLMGVLADRYRIDTLLGRGGYGVVYKGFDEKLRRPVAIKIAHAKTSAELLLDEARRVARLRHSGIVSVFDAGQHEGRVFLIFELIEGRSLTEIIQDKRSSIPEAVSLVIEVAKALHYAHKRDCIHRDIKPDNIMIDQEGRPLIADFGVAVTVDELQRGRFASVGTLEYMSPEQLLGEVQLLDGRSDIYSLGVVLFELLTGQLPFRASTPTKLREQILLRSPRRPRDVDSTIPEELDTICFRCLAKHPDDRFADCQGLTHALEQWLDSQ